MKNIKKTLKLKDIIVNHIASNSKEYIIVTLLFIIGIFLGVLFVNNIKNDEFDSVQNYITTFIQKFKEEFGNIEKYYKKGKTIENEPTEKVVEKQKYYFDTTKLIIDYLMEIGIKKENIFDSNICSVCNSNKMHSYRAEKELADRNMNIIELL